MQEIKINSRWKDTWGVKITIKKAGENRVSYVRDGYEHECICSPDRLRREFILVRATVKPSGDLERVMQATSGAERISVMREIIQEQGKVQ